MEVHLIGGPREGEVLWAPSAPPCLVGETNEQPYTYRLVRWTQVAGTVMPGSPVFYVWGQLTSVETAAAVNAYLDRTGVNRSTLAGTTL